MTDTASAMGQAFDDSKTDDSFYLPPEAFDSPDFQRGLKLMLSPDGKSAQFIITHDVDPATPEGISHVDAEMQAAKEAVKVTTVRRQVLPRRHRGHLQGHPGGCEVGPVDRGSRRDHADLHGDADHHARTDRVVRHRRHGRAVTGGIVRTVGDGVAVPVGYRTALDDTGVLGHRLAGRRFRLQPAGGLPIQGRNGRGHQDWHHQSDGCHRRCRDSRRPRLRGHNGIDGDQRPGRNWPDRHHNRTRAAVRHIGGAVADDAVHRGAPGPLVLVATASAQPTDADRTDTGSTTDTRHRMRAIMSVGGSALLGIMVVVAGVAVAWPAHADPDTDFANELHTYGIYGQKDYNAWIGKIRCKRLYNGLDQDAEKSAKFVFTQLPTGSTTEQAWQFLGAAINTYCPEQAPVLHRAAGQG